MRSFPIALILLLASVSTAEGQSGERWLILPTTAGPNDAWVQPTADRLRSELGTKAWQLREAATQFETVGSSAAATVSEDEIQQWIDDSNKAIRDLAEGDYTKALNHLKEAHELSRRATEALNREHELAQRMLDTCLYSVRVLLETGVRSRTRTRAEECRQLVPRVEPTAHMHPPAVLDVLTEVDDFRATKPRLLEVESEPSGCGVRVNGVMLGQTPLEVRDLFPGEYGVQVECEPGRSGRVRVADLTTASTSVFVDARFDRTVSTRPILHLRYDSAEAESQFRMTDAVQVAGAVPARWILLASKPEAGVLVLELTNGEPLRQSAVVRIPTGPEAPSSADASLAIRTLIDGKCTDFTSGEPVRLPCPGRDAEAGPVTEDGWPTRRTPRGQFVAGATLAAVGSASLVTGYLLLVPQARAANDWLAQIDAGAIETPAEQAKWINVNNAIVITSSVGAAALVAAMPLVLPKRNKTPWPAWLAGGVGIGALAFSIAYGVTGERPPTSCRSGDNVNNRPGAEACITQAERVSAAVLAGTTAAPLLTIPLVYLLRGNDKKLEPRVEASRHGGYFGLRGAF